MIAHQTCLILFIESLFLQVAAVTASTTVAVSTPASIGENVTEEQVGAQRRGEETLLNTITARSRYDKRVKPRHIDETGKEISIRVTSQLYDAEVLDVDVGKGFTKILSFLKFQWVDERLAWNVSEYGEISRVSIESRELWIPDFVMMNSQKVQRSTGLPITASVKYTGVVNYYISGPMEVPCSFDLSYFPYDSQRCHLMMDMWSSHVGLVHFVYIPSILLGKTNYTNPLWNIVSSEGVTSEVVYTSGKKFSKVHVALCIRRKGACYLLILLLPIALLLLSNIAILFQPIDEGGRIPNQIQLLLALTVFLTLLAQEMPKSSESQALFSLYVVGGLVFSCGSLLNSVLIRQFLKQSAVEKHRIAQGISELLVTPNFKDSDNDKCPRAEKYISLANTMNTLTIIVGLFVVLTPPIIFGIGMLL